MSALTARGTATGLILLGLALGGIATMMPWIVVPGVDTTVTAVSGLPNARPALQSLAGVLVGTLAAGWLLSLTLPPRGKQVVGVLLGLLAVPLVVVPFLTLEVEASVVSAVGAAPEVTAWRWLLLPAGFAAGMGAGAMVIGAPRWSRESRRFDRDTPENVAVGDDPADVWKAMDAGVDPTRDDADADHRGDTRGTGGDPRADGPK